MPRYHISRRKGEPAVCEATIRCPFGDLVTEHYDSREEAMDAYEEKLKTLLFPPTPGSNMTITPLPDSLRIDGDTIIVPKGIYVLGDPTFTAGRDERNWQQWKKVSKSERLMGNAFGAYMNGHLVVGLKTLSGEGTYIDNSGQSFPVDGGMIGLTSLNLLKKQGFSYDQILSSGVVVSFDEATEVSYEYGMLNFGPNINIFTDENIEENNDNLYDIDHLLKEDTSQYDRYREDSLNETLSIKEQYKIDNLDDLSDEQIDEYYNTIFGNEKLDDSTFQLTEEESAAIEEEKRNNS